MLNLFGEPTCTLGHEVSCKMSQSSECNCDCGGKNHGILVKNKKRKVQKSKKKMNGSNVLIVVVRLRINSFPQFSYAGL